MAAKKKKPRSKKAARKTKSKKKTRVLKQRKKRIKNLVEDDNQDGLFDSRKGDTSALFVSLDNLEKIDELPELKPADVVPEILPENHVEQKKKSFWRKFFR
jgi:hypothetical protein